ncbi:MAG TPA: M20/M25/M40 family metallo-hydrolase [Verrucomicrobiota bacterium]|nr:M20/M25/M40 family metallo-hydrolase [Verrucomicrobiota bacterium]
MNKTAKLLHELIALPSVNPAFLPPNHPRAGEQRVAEFIAATAARAGMAVAFQAVSKGRANVIVRLAPSGKIHRRILLAPHLDTVNAAFDVQFMPRVKSGRVYGRGACDTKGSVAAMLGALCDVARSQSRPRETEIVFAGLVDEEHAQAGSRALAKSRLKADLAIVGEPTGLQVITAHKGNLWLELETHGRAAHGSTPQFGHNAVHDMARIVDVLQTDYVRLLKKRRHSLLGHPTANVGVICGGTQANIVPDRCTIEVDRRTLPGETDSGVRREILALLRSKGLKARLQETKAVPCLPLETDTRHPLVNQFLRDMGGRKPLGVHFFCDAAVLSAGGNPSVVFGPGDIAQAHTSDEWISLAQVERARSMLARFLKSQP